MYTSGCSNIHDKSTTINTTITKQWVKNFSSIPLNKAQESLLVHGPNYAMGPQHPFSGEYITIMEEVGQRLKTQEAEKLRAEITGGYKIFLLSLPNITREEFKA